MVSPKPATNFITSTKPAAWKLKGYQLFYFLFGWLGRMLLATKFDTIKVIGIEHLSGGPKLLLMNHSCPLDPLLITFFGGKPLQFLVSEGFMQQGAQGKLASFFGQITKRKLDFDTSSIRLMKAWADLGGTVATFPEGKFSWDGLPSPLMPGLDQLILYLNIPVIPVHLSNGNKVKPAWAKFYRKTSIHITIKPAITFQKGDAILPVITRLLFQNEVLDYMSSGKNLAHGLARHLRFCPFCFKDAVLVEQGDQLLCKSCHEGFIINANNEILHPQYKTIRQIFESSYLAIDQHWSENKKISSRFEVELIDITEFSWQTTNKAILHIDQTQLQLGQWTLPLKDITAHTIDFGDLIIIKTRFKRYGLKMPNDSRAVFTHLLNKVVACT